MIRQMLRLVWNRKRSNALIMIEIFFSFLVIFALVSASVYSWSRYTRPLGYQYGDVWNIAVDAKETRTERPDPDLKVRLERVVTQLRALDRVESASLIHFTPFTEDVYEDGREHQGRSVSFQYNAADEALDETLDLKMTRGRWFDATDTSSVPALVIDEEAAEIFFGSEDPIGKQLKLGDEIMAEGAVVGVLADFRRGDLAQESAYIFREVDTANPDQERSRHILVELSAGTGADFEETLVRRLQAIEPGWSFDVRSLEQLREANLRFRLVPLMIAAIIAAFLAMTVALGLLGVLWQNVTQRTREIGLRRAIGASSGSVQLQVLGELLIVTSVSVILGTLVVVQIPLAGMITTLSGGVFMAGLLISLTLIYLLATSCALYPSWLATRIEPADALRTE